MIGVIIQARMGSTRLPGKVLFDILGKPMLLHQVGRISKSKSIDKIIVATTTNESDDPIVKLCEERSILYFRGSEDDVLSRYYECAKKFGIQTIVRSTADCPLIDPQVIDSAIDLFQESQLDYLANTVPQELSCWPDGSDVEIFSFDALEKAYKEASEFEDREHVTFFFWKNLSSSSSFKVAQLKNDLDWSGYRYTVDYKEDLLVVEAIFKHFFEKNYFPYTEDIILYLRNNQNVRRLNEKYYFGMGWDKSKKYVKS
jgi:spore coat polysaccharide biosynthesis protein SpsF